MTKRKCIFLFPYLTFPKGTILIERGKLLARGGYKIKELNTIMVNTKDEGEKSSEDFKNPMDLMFDRLEKKTWKPCRKAI